MLSAAVARRRWTTIRASEPPPQKGRISLPNGRLSMRKIKDVLRLRHELGMGQRQIARSCAIGQATVADYLKRAAAVGIGWPLPQDWDEGPACFAAATRRTLRPQPLGSGARQHRPPRRLRWQLVQRAVCAHRRTG